MLFRIGACLTVSVTAGGRQVVDECEDEDLLVVSPVVIVSII